MSLLLYMAELVLESLLLYIPFAVLHFISGNIKGSTASFPFKMFYYFCSFHLE